MTRDEIEAKARAVDAKRQTDREADIAWNNRARLCDYPASADRSLWRAVIVQAFDDATGDPQSEKSNFGRDSNDEIPAAREWLTEDYEDFEFVCDLAGVEPDAVRNRAMISKKMGWAA